MSPPPVSSWANVAPPPPKTSSAAAVPAVIDRRITPPPGLASNRAPFGSRVKGQPGIIAASGETERAYVPADSEAWPR